MTAHESEAAQPADRVRDAARQGAFDFYLSALLAPARNRDDRIVLAAFWAETGRITITAGEALVGEIKLQWWRDALAADAGASGHPVADALRQAMARHQLDRGLITAILEARTAELERLPFPDEAAFGTYLAQADGSLLRLLAAVSGEAVTAEGEAFLAAVAQSIGRTRVALTLPDWSAHGRLPLWPAALGQGANEGWETGPGGADVEGQVATATPEGHHAVAVLAAGARRARKEALALSAGQSRGLIAAALPLALVEPYLHALEDGNRDPLRDLAEIAPVSRVARLGWAHAWRRL